MHYRWTVAVLLGAVAVAAATVAPLAGAGPPGVPGASATGSDATSRASHTSPAASTPPSTAGPTSSGALPDVVGQTLVQAQATADVGPLTLSGDVTAVAVDLSVPPETITAQTGVHLTISVPSDPPCRTTQLAATYGMIQGGMGNLFAGVVLRNTSSAWCALAPSLRLVGLSSAGTPDTTALAFALANPEADALSPEVPSITIATAPSSSGAGNGYPVGARFAFIGFSGPVSTCVPSTPGSSVTRITPVAWRVSTASGWTVTSPNGFAGVAGRQISAATGTPFSSCGGELQPETARIR